MSRSQKGVAPPLVDDDGLHPVEQHNYPEFVPNYQNLPEVVRNKEDEKYVAVQTSDFDKHALPAPPGYNSNIYQAEGPPDEVQSGFPTNPSKRQRICGLSRRAFTWAAVVSIVVLLGTIGGVLGGVLASKKSSSVVSTASNNGTSANNNGASANNSTPVNNAAYAYAKAQSMTGLAMVGTTSSYDGSSRLYVYYATEAGTIVELAYPANAWRQNFKTSNVTITNVTSDAIVNSSIAAIAYSQSDGSQIRQIFYYSSSNNVVSSTSFNSSGNGGWSTPFNLIPTATAQKHNSPLAATVGTGTNTDGLNGIRVYYGTDLGWGIQELGVDFRGPLTKWTFLATFTTAGDNTGVAVTNVDHVKQVYFRDPTTGNLQQWTFDFTLGIKEDVGNGGWDYSDVLSWRGFFPGLGSSIAIGSTGTSESNYIDSLVYRTNSSSTLVTSYSVATNTTTTTGLALDTANNPSQLGIGLAAWGTGTDTVVLSQDPGQPEILRFQSMSLSGNVQASWYTDTGV